jgi:putative DNA primase/helicase
VVAAAETHYGHAGRAFLENLTRDKRDWKAQYAAFKGAPEFTVEDADGQVKRAASKFALVAMAGELAIELSYFTFPILALGLSNRQIRQFGLRRMAS